MFRYYFNPATTNPTSDPLSIVSYANSWGCKCTSASAYCENKKALNLKKPEDTITVYSSLVIFRV